MATVRAAVMPAPRVPLEIREFTEPDLSPGSMLLHTLYSEVCGTDVHLWHGRLSGVPYPIIPGHVSVGHLAAARGVSRDVESRPLREGDLVAFYDVHRACGRCFPCAVWHTPTRCEARRVYGITDPASEGLFGGWSEAIYLEPGVIAAALPAGVTPESYIGGGCGLITAVHAIDRAGIRLADTVVVQGSGAVGLSVIALARLSGAGLVIAIGAPPDRLALARRMGADLVLDVTTSTNVDRAAAVRQVTRGRGVDVVIEASGSARAVEEGPGLARDGGTYVIVGHYTDAGPSQVNAHQHINRKHLDVRGCWGSEAGHFVRALRILARHGAERPWHEIGARTFGLHELDEALAGAERFAYPKALVRPRSTS
jgi:L-iditol 2-dehydrogenase